MVRGGAATFALRGQPCGRECPTLLPVLGQRTGHLRPKAARPVFRRAHQGPTPSAWRPAATRRVASRARRRRMLRPIVAERK